LTTIEDYFKAERSESMLFILVGLVAIGLSIYFLVKFNQPFYTGLVFPLILIALIQITVGTTVYIRSPKDVDRVQKYLEYEDARIQSDEIPRMQEVMKSFVIYRYIEIVLLLIGIVLIIFFSRANLWMGVGVGLSIQAAFMLALDYFAEQRGNVYLEFLKQS